MKDPELEDECKLLFNGSINITLAGKRHLGASIGTTEFKQEYIDEKVQKWVNNIENLAKIAEAQPHAAYAAFIHGEQHKYTSFEQLQISLITSNHLTTRLIKCLFRCFLEVTYLTINVT